MVEIPPTDDGGVDSRLLELVRLRVATIHCCAESIAHHAEILHSRGESIQLDELETWKTSSLFDGPERAALALCEQIALDPAEPLPDFLIQEMRHHFTKEAIVSLTMAIMAANDWNFPHGPSDLVPERRED